jgi:hypothetical protein
MTQKLRYCFITLILILSSCVYGQDISSTIMGDMILCFLKHAKYLENGTGDLAKLIPAHQQY